MRRAELGELAILIFVLYIALRFVNYAIMSRHRVAKMHEWSCEEAPIEKNRLPLGIDQILQSLKADRAKAFPPLVLERQKKMGVSTFRTSVLGSEGILTNDPKNIQAILATQFDHFDLGPLRRLIFFPLLGNGIFTLDGEGWEHSRTMLRPQFSREQVSDLDLEERHVQNMMRALPVQSNNWTQNLDLQVLFFRLTIDSATEFLFGESVSSQLAALPGYQKSSAIGNPQDETTFATAFNVGQMALATRARFGEFYWAVNPKGFKQACRDCHAFIDYFVQLALTRHKSGALSRPDNLQSEGKGRYIFLEALAAQSQDPVELRSQLLNILLAGRDTTASLLGWLFYSLARSPSHYKKLREVVIGEFGEYSSSGPENITFAKLKSCRYLQHCLKEALRLYPVVPINTRTATRDTVLPRGGGLDGKSKVFVPKGMSVDYCVYAMHRDPEYWGNDAEEFKPERWEGRRPGWEFLPVSLAL